MVLIRRFSRLLRADMHAVLDQLEDPALLLRQSLREMGDVLDLDRRRLQATEHAIGQLQRRRDDLNAQAAELSTEIDSCFAADREDLLRILLRRRLENDALGKSIESQLQTLERERDDASNLIQDRSARYEVLQRQAELFDAVAIEEPQVSTQHSQVQIRDADVELALLRERQRRAAS